MHLLLLCVSIVFYIVYLPCLFCVSTLSNCINSFFTISNKRENETCRVVNVKNIFSKKQDNNQDLTCLQQFTLYKQSVN